MNDTQITTALKAMLADTLQQVQRSNEHAPRAWDHLFDKAMAVREFLSRADAGTGHVDEAQALIRLAIDNAYHARMAQVSQDLTARPEPVVPMPSPGPGRAA